MPFVWHRGSSELALQATCHRDGCSLGTFSKPEAATLAPVLTLGLFQEGELAVSFFSFNFSLMYVWEAEERKAGLFVYVHTPCLLHSPGLRSFNTFGL